ESFVGALSVFFFQAEDGIRDFHVTGVQTCALPILMVGAELIVASPDGHRDPLYVADMIERHRVTVTDFVPSMLTVFVSHATPEQVRSLRAVFVIGEALPPETAAQFRALTGADGQPAGLHNLYGPTEAAVSVTYWEATPADTVTVPIGIPEWNVDVYVLDSRLR